MNLNNGISMQDRMVARDVVNEQVMEGGFFSRIRAQEYIWREYEKSETE